MILSDREIRAALNNGFIKITPEPAEEHWTSTAIDLTLDKTLVRWKELGSSFTGNPNYPRPMGSGFNISQMLKDTSICEKVVISENGFLFKPREFILGFTVQSICLPIHSRIAARVEGKSSLARLGVGVHVTAPTIHAGFGYNPQNIQEAGRPIQLEIFNVSNLSVILDADMPICQLILEEVREVPSKGYSGQFSSQQIFTQ